MLGCEPLDDAPIFDLRIRKGVRRHGVKLAIATSRPSALDPNARLSVRFPPGGEAEFLAALDVALAATRALGPDSDARPGREAAARRRRGHRDPVGRAVARRGGARHAAEHRRAARARGPRRRRPARDPRGRERPRAPRGRRGPGHRARVYARARRVAGPRRGGDRPGGAPTATSPRCACSRPIRSAIVPTGRCGNRRSTAAGLVVAHASVLTEGLAEHANVVFPAESYAEKEGTVVHPDGRLQRLRIAIAHPGSVRAGWSVIAEHRQARRARHRRADSADGVRAAGRGGPVLPRDLRSRRSAGAACAGPSSTSRRSCRRRRPTRRARPARRGRDAASAGARTARPARTARCGSGRTARSGPRPRSRSRRRSSSPSPASRSSSRPRMRGGSASATATRSTCRRTGRGFAAPPTSAPASRRAPRSSPTASPTNRRTRSPNRSSRCSKP